MEVRPREFEENLLTPFLVQTPIIFTKAAESVIGPGEAIRYPHGVSSEVDYEAGTREIDYPFDLGGDRNAETVIHLPWL